ncbi:MAG TPA: beta-phosphoglucomutase family hydrolase [Bacteroidales bacterium]|nr:beta-phosphoglucomutase family hydrolase [Bacteroidales bacterium]HSA42543.1 beta-phosphoglucomutase family hydrolase [Bacteroidales bacterium]
MTTPLPFHAVVFDLDGVVTQTALVHSRAWKHMFDEYLRLRESRNGEPFREFDHGTDYRRYVDGKPRYDGVRSFLSSRGISLPEGSSMDGPDEESICGLGNRKNDSFHRVLEQQGVEVYPSTLRLIGELREAGIPCGIASSSRNAEAVLERAGIRDLFVVVVDGLTAERSGLKGKPEPDIFLHACQAMGAEPMESVVIEDAVSGVEAARKGHFGLVIGIAREGGETELLAHGADIVCTDLGQSGMADIIRWFTEELEQEQWMIRYHDYQPALEKTRESLLTTGNGRFASRGCQEESKDGPYHYPGTYMAGLYNRLHTRLNDRDIANEDLVNCPNWLGISFRPAGGSWFDVDQYHVSACSRTLHMKQGLLSRSIRATAPDGKTFLVRSERFVSMANPDLACLRYSLTPLDSSGIITIRSEIDGNILNSGVERYKQFENRHLKPAHRIHDSLAGFLLMQTKQSGIYVNTAYRHRITEQEVLKGMQTDISGEACLQCYFRVEVTQGQTVTIEKFISLTSFRDSRSGTELLHAGFGDGHPDFDTLLQDSAREWSEIWKSADIRIKADRQSQKLLRMHIYHLMVSMSKHNLDTDSSIGARGLHGEAYRGHIFWDELFIQPFYNMHFPGISRAMLLYRYNRLEKARENALEKGLQGALFPWQSGSDGREETQTIHLNPLSGKWDPDHSSLQRHVSLAIAWNVLQYHRQSGDQAFMRDFGFEMLTEICRCWVSMCTFNPETNRYDTHGVMGPDEFHESYPDSETAGLTNNAYTNLLLAFILEETVSRLTAECRGEAEEMKRWENISRSLTIHITEEGIIEQFRGWSALKELDWEGYRARYGNIYRLDRILKAEGLSPDAYRLSKQADTLMIFYLLGPGETGRLLKRLGYSLPEGYFEKNFRYYLQRCSHGSSLSRIVHTRLAHMAGDQALARDLFRQALLTDYGDVQGGTTAEGIHTGVMAACLEMAVRCLEV